MKEEKIEDPKPVSAAEENAIEDKAKVAKENGAELFTLGTSELKTNINVVGKIDLSSINQQTRPKKKSKEERRKEREQRKPSFNKNPNQSAGDTSSSDDKGSNMIRTNVPRLNGPKVVGSIDLKANSSDADKKKKGSVFRRSVLISPISIRVEIGLQAETATTPMATTIMEMVTVTRKMTRRKSSKNL